MKAKYKFIIIMNKDVDPDHLLYRTENEHKMYEIFEKNNIEYSNGQVAVETDRYMFDVEVEDDVLQGRRLQTAGAELMRVFKEQIKDIEWKDYIEGKWY